MPHEQSEDRHRLKHAEGPDEWVSGHEQMTGAQASYLNTLCEQAGCADQLPDDLTKAETSKIIDEVREKAGIN